MDDLKRCKVDRISQLVIISQPLCLRECNLSIKILANAQESKALVIPGHSITWIDLKDKPEEFDAVVLPGGSPGFINLKNDERVLRILQDMNEAGKYVCAICAGAISSDKGRSS